jgi:hypothetical protein
LPEAVAESLNAAAKQLSHLYECLNTTTIDEHGEELEEDGCELTAEGKYTAQSSDQLTNGSAQPYSEQPSGRIIFLHLYRTNVSFRSIIVDGS